MREGMSAHDLSVDGGDARGRRVAIHMCIRMRWKRHARDRDRRRSGARVTSRTGRGTRGGARVDRATTYRAWREGCVWFSGACAGRWRLDTRGTSSSELRSEGRRRNARVPAHAKSEPANCKEISQVIRPSPGVVKQKRSKGQESQKSPNHQRVADWTSQ